VPVAAVNPEEVRGIERVDDGGIQNEFGLQIIQKVVPDYVEYNKKVA
jgi:hypothetical protein